MNRMRFIAVALALVAAVTALTVRGATAQKLEESPGYFDVTALEGWFDSEPKIEVNIKGALMKLVAEAARIEDPDLADVLRGLRAIHVRGFHSDDAIYSEVRGRMSGVSRDLESRGWETVVRVREDDESVNMMLRTNGDIISGMVVMVADAEETVFINIVGEIDPAQVGRLGRRLNVDKLDRDW